MRRCAGALLAFLVLLGVGWSSSTIVAGPAGTAVASPSVLVAPAVAVVQLAAPTRVDPGVAAEPPAPAAVPVTAAAPAAAPGRVAALSPAAVHHAGGRSPPASS